MSEEFERCDSDPHLRLGDVLVYRDDMRGDGHTVMVIDPEKRIAWGSHGFDGNVTIDETSDTGVEYQLIKYKQDWQRWDRRTMTRKACWRYKQFIEEAEEPGGQPGTAALEDCCNPNSNCGKVDGQ